MNGKRLFIGLASAVSVAAISAGTYLVVGGGEYTSGNTPTQSVVPVAMPTERIASSDDVAAITRIAKQFVSEDAATGTTTATYVTTTLGAALSAAYDSPTPDDGTAGNEVLLVMLSGKFVGGDAPIPLGAKAPTGSLLYFIYAPDRGRVSSWGIGPTALDTSSLGPVQALDIG